MYFCYSSKTLSAVPAVLRTASDVGFHESVARQQAAYCRERIAYHRDEASLALADAVNDDVGRNKQQGRCYYIIRVGKNRIAVFFCKVLQLITC